MQQQLPHASTSLEELHRHPLWRYGSTAAQWPEPRSTSSHHSSRPLAPAEAESALLAYVRMAAEAEQQADGSPRQQARRLAQLSPTDIAAELHALYTLAAIHVAHQQESPEQQQGGSRHKQQHGSKPSLTEGDIMQLLKAYSALEDRGHQQQQQQQQPGSGDSSSGPEWDSQAQAAAAAMGALYAFARLADQQQEQSQSQQEQDVSQQDGQPGQQAQRAQQPTAAPGQLRASSSSDSNTVQQAFKSLAASSSMDGVRGSNSSAASGDLQVLLKLAQLGLQAASG